MGSSSSMKQILLAYDGSHFAESALGDLPRMGLAPDVEICILVVVVKSASAEQLEVAERQSQHAAQVINGLLPAATVRLVVRAGAAAEQIVREAIGQPSELIVIGAHGKSLVERFLFGSVSAEVATEAPCSVRICRTQSEPGFQHLRLTLAIDGSPASDVAIARTLERPWPQGTGFHVVTVADPKKPDLAVHETIAEVAEQLKALGYYALPLVLEGDPAKALLKDGETWAPQCLLLGARGADHGTTRKLGSLATEMVKAGASEVEIMR
jgi:nucleotide-binding universal stress UspA family protein